MINWIHDLPVGWLVVVVLAGMTVITAATYGVVMGVAGGDRGPKLQISPGMLPPMALVFGLLVGFLVAQLWSNASSARAAVNQEASSLRTVVLLAGSFPGKPEAGIDALVRQHIETAVTKEWPAMAHQNATLTEVPRALAGALRAAVALNPRTVGQQVAQREIVTSLESALDARRQRIILSQSTVNWVKWTAVIALSILTLIGIALVHSDNRRNAKVAMTIFAAATAVTIVVIASEDRPFSGPFRVSPAALIQVLPPSAPA